MRRMLSLAAIAAVLIIFAGSSAASAQTSGAVTGFGGLTVNGSSMQPIFGGNVAYGLTPNIQVVGEVARISDVLPSLVDRLIALTPADLRVSAFYGEGGVRFLTDSRARAAGYVQATAGFARLSTRVSGIPSADPYVNAALGFFDRTSPMLGVGGGVLLGMGPAVLDLGYRYNRILNNNPVDQVLMLGNNAISVNQVRIGVGIRF